MTEETKAIVSSPFNVEETELPFGKRWGQRTVELTSNDLVALQKGKCIALDVMDE